MGQVEAGARTSVRSVDVAIVGYGPVGATAANFLGAMGLDVVVVERDPSPYARARAISTDEEVIRVWQQIGLAERLKQDMLGDRPIDFVDRDGRSFMSLAPRSQGNGHPPQMFIYQPAVEQVLREGVDRFDTVELLLEHEMRDLRQTLDGVELSVVDLRDGTESTVRSRYVLACDGGSSRTRTLLGIGFEGRTFEDPWLVVDTKVKTPWPEVDRLRFHCDPERPAVDCPTPLAHHRWEFPVLPGEDGEQLATEESVWELLARHGITSEHVEVLRRAVYVHHVRFAERWREGRVFLLGDAAHVMPPWIGQGMAAGVRDAGNLCWKLAAVIHGTAAEALLDTYQDERQPHVRSITQRAVFFGRVITERRAWRAAVRNRVFRTAMKTPWLGRFIYEARWLTPTAYKDGFVSDGKAAKGRGALVPQPVVETAGHDRIPLDDALGLGWAVIARPGPQALPPHVEEQWRAAGARVLRLGEAGEGGLRDLDGLLEDWMRRLGADALALRPDRIVYASGSARHPLAPPSALLHPQRKAVRA